MHKLSKAIKGIDWLILIPALFILSIGILVQYAILFKTKGIAVDFRLDTQIVALFMGFVAVAVISFFASQTWRSKSYIFYIASLILLLLVALFGSDANGSERWIVVGGFQLQPTEIAKLSTIFYLAHILDVKTKKANRILRIFKSLIIVGIPAALVIVQPDLGSAIVFVAIWLAMLFNSRIEIGRFVGLIIVLIGLTFVFVPFLAEYQQERLVSYFNPDKDTQGANYNVVQAGIAIGSGGVLGNGLDSGSQSQLNFLPSQHTDFVFAVTAEKLGLVGAASIIFAFLVLYTRMLYIAWRSRSQFERLVVVGIAAFLFFHTLVNIGMNVGMMPVTGLPLPLLSYGGTFLFVTVLAIGVTMIISHRQYTYNLKHS